MDGEAVFEVAPDGQEAFRIIQLKKEMTMMSYGDLQRWKDIFKQDCYQECLRGPVRAVLMKTPSNTWLL